MDKTSKAAESSSRRIDDTLDSDFIPNPILELQPVGVAELEKLVQVCGRIADAVENQNRSVIQALPPEALSYVDAAQFLGVDVPAVKELVRTRKLAFVQYGSQRGRLILVEDLRKFLRKYRQASDEETNSKRRRA